MTKVVENNQEKNRDRLLKRLLPIVLIKTTK